MAFFFWRGFEIAGGGVDVWRVNPLVNRIRRREFGGQCAIGGFDDFAIHFGFQSFDFAFLQDAFAHEEHGKFRERIALRFGGAFGLALVEFFVVGKRMRIGADDVRVDQRRTFAGAAMFGGAAQRGVTFQRLGAVAFLDVQIRIIPDELGNAAAGSLHFDRDRNGVAVVFDEIENREALAAGGVQRFVKFAFAGGAVTGGNVSDLVVVKGDRGAHRSFARLSKALGNFSK